MASTLRVNVVSTSCFHVVSTSGINVVAMLKISLSMSANWLCKHQIVTFFRSTSTVNRSLLCSFSYFVYDAYVDVCAWVCDTVAQWSWGGAFDSYCSSIIGSKESGENARIS